VRVLTLAATFFHSLPYCWRARRKASCSSRVQRPVDSWPFSTTFCLVVGVVVDVDVDVAVAVEACIA